MSLAWRSVKYLSGRYLLRRPFLTGHAGGASFRFKTEDVVGRQIYKRGIYEADLTHLVEREVRLGAGDVALDVGANIGWYAVLLSRLASPGARVFAFEPEPLNFELLRHNLAANGCAHVTPVAQALAAAPGKRSLYRYPSKNLGRHSLLPINAAAPLEIEAVAGDSFLAEQGIDPARVRFIKIDVEGFEHQVVLGLRRCLESCPLVMCEFSPPYMRRGGQDVAGFLALLDGYGYRPYRFEGRGTLGPASTSELLALDSTVDLIWRRERH